MPRHSGRPVRQTYFGVCETRSLWGIDPPTGERVQAHKFGLEVTEKSGHCPMRHKSSASLQPSVIQAEFKAKESEVKE